MKLRVRSCGLAMSATACLLVCSPALAANRSTAQLRHAFGQVFLSLRLTGNPAVCSSATAQGRFSLIEKALFEKGRGQLFYLPSITCADALVGLVATVTKQWGEYCRSLEPTAPEFAAIIKSARIRVSGNHGTVRLVTDRVCGQRKANGAIGIIEGPEAVKVDPLGTSHWIRRHGRWLFDDPPTGTYSPAGRKAVAMLRAALNGSVVTTVYPPPRVLTLSVGFCATGGIHTTITVTHSGEPPTVKTTTEAGPWYVAAGVGSEPPFDAQGNPQGRISLERASFIVSIEWSVKLVGGTLVVTEESGAQAVMARAASGC